MSMRWLKGKPLGGIGAEQEAQKIAKALETSEVLVTQVDVSN
jgi:hypothetical protein